MKHENQDVEATRLLLAGKPGVLDVSEEDAALLASNPANAFGYRFSWGLLSESLGEDEEDGEAYVWFEVSPQDVIKVVLGPDWFGDFYIYLYEHHPRASADFDAGESVSLDGHYTLSFSASGEKEIQALREWMGKEFIPNILPDLNFEAMLLAAKIRKAVGETEDPEVIGSAFDKFHPEPSKFSFLQKKKVPAHSLPLN